MGASELLGVLVSLESIALGVLWWYHGRKTRELNARAAAAEAALGSLKSVNAELRASLDRVVKTTVDRNEREAQHDAQIADAARSDAVAAALLLAGLHEGRPGPGPGVSRDRLPAGPAAGLPAAKAPGV